MDAKNQNQSNQILRVASALNHWVISLVASSTPFYAPLETGSYYVAYVGLEPMQMRLASNLWGPGWWDHSVLHFPSSSFDSVRHTSRKDLLYPSSSSDSCKETGLSEAGSAETAYLREVWLGGRVLPKLWVWVLIVDIVAHTNELLSMVGAGDKNHSHTHSVRLGNEGWVWGISLGRHILGFSTANQDTKTNQRTGTRQTDHTGDYKEEIMNLIWQHHYSACIVLSPSNNNNNN